MMALLHIFVNSLMCGLMFRKARFLMSALKNTTEAGEKIRA